MAGPTQDRSLIASSEFDPNGFIKGIDQMTGALQKLSAEEDALQAQMAQTNAALKANRVELKNTQDQITALDKSSATYAQDLKKLQDQQTALTASNKALRETMTQQKAGLNEINQAAVKYKDAITGLNAISKQVASENKGRTLFDVASMNAQIQEVTQLGTSLRDVFKGKIDTAELDKFEQQLAGTDDEMKQLAQTVEFVKSKLDTLDPNSQEFADLNRVIEVGDQVLEEYGKTTENVDKKAVSLRGRLRQMREELARLEDQGKDNTKEFQDLQIAAGQLQDQLGDTQQRIKVLSSDTKNLDFGIGAIRGVASAFGVAEGAAALFGIKNEDVMQSIQRLNSIMLILNGLQEIQNLLQKQSVVYIVGQEVATKAAAIAQGIYATAVGTSTGAMRAFRIALLATGIGAFVVLLGLAADAMGLFSDKTEEATEDNTKFTESLDNTVQSLQSLNKWQSTATAVREEQLKRQGANEQKLYENRKKGLEDERARTVKAYGDIRASQDQYLAEGRSTGDFIEKSNQEATTLFNRINDIDDQIRLEREKNLTRQYEDQKKAREKELALWRAYQDRLTALQREYRDKLLEAQPQDEAAIRQTFTNQLDDALADLDKDVKEGKLTKNRAKILSGLIKQINTVDLQEAVKKFQADAEKAEDDLANSIYDLRIKNGQERAELMRDQFTREATIVRIESRNQATQLKRERDEVIKSINDTRDQGLISPAAAAENVERIEEIYSQLLENLAEQTTRKQEDISARMFQAAQADLQRVFSDVQLYVSEAATDEIVRATNRYLRGQTTYENYQKELTRIARDESQKRIATALEEQEAILKGVEARIAAEQDPERLKGLQDQERQIRQTIADLRRQEAQANAEGQQAETQERGQRIQELAQYAQAVGGIISQVVGFWQAANQAEAESLSRSIALQERRVEAATRIAERGNAEYLRLEEDRLNELQVKQENAARRQLAINAVLQTSQALTAFVTALAQGIATGGPLGGIAIAASVIGLIASGYAIIQSLQKNNVQSFWEGTKSVQRNGNPAGRDTVPAMLTEDEAVIPRDRNQAYRDTVAAIYDRTVPAEELNNFVNSYHVNRRRLPRLNSEKIEEAQTTVVNYDGKLLEASEKQSKQLAENNELMRIMDKTLKSIGVDVTIDKNGLSLSLMKAVQQHKIDKKA